MLTISVLGPVEVRRNGRPLLVPAGKTTELLVRLALDAGTLISGERLVEELWGAEAVRTSRNTLQSKVAKLRRALGDPTVLISDAGGYRLVVEPACVDALAVLAEVVDAGSLFDRGADHDAAVLCATARQRFHGDLVPAAGDGEWALPFRTRLHAALVQLVEIENAARLRLGEVGDVIIDLQAATEVFPFQESLWVLLITALYRAGRQADALGAFQQVRHRLADELGLEPGPQLRALEQQILVQDARLDEGAAQVLPAAVTPVGNLPTMMADLVGRDAELAEVADLLASRRLVVIVGTGGVGKTAVALAAAARSTAAGGVWLARLDAASTGDEVEDAVIAALGVTGGEAALRERLRANASLLVLDNCEHVADAAADLANRLLDAAAGLRILCTSQVPLGMDGEAVFEMSPLGLDDAVQLFTQRAASHRRRRSADVTSDELRELCRSLDGLPLAIELAAARTRTLSVAEIGRRLDDRFDVLSDPNSRRPERRRALRATIGWSYDLLFPDDQRGLWALSTFAGGASLEAVEQVLASLDVPARTAIDVLGRLNARSLVLVDETGDGGFRYRLLDSIRAFARDAMHGAGLGDTAGAAHAAWLAAVAEGSTTGVRSGQQADHLATARAERANIDVALHWCLAHDPAQALTIVEGFGWAWVVLGDSRGAQRILAALDAVGDTAPASRRGSALLLAAWLEASTGDLEPARRHIDLALALADDVDDVELRARGTYYLSYVVAHGGDFRHGLELAARSRMQYTGLDRPWDLAANALFAMRAAISAADSERAVVETEIATDALGKVDDPWLHVRFEGLLGEFARLQLRFADAVVHLRTSSARARQLGFLQTEAYQVATLGRAEYQNGDHFDGAATLRLAIDKAEAVGDVRMAALARVHLGRVLRALGDDTGARAALEDATRWHREAGGGEQAVLGDTLLAAMDLRQDVDGAHQRLMAVLADARAAGNSAATVFALDALASDAARHGDTATAQRLADDANAAMRTATHFIAEVDRVDKLPDGSQRRRPPAMHDPPAPSSPTE